MKFFISNFLLAILILGCTSEPEPGKQVLIQTGHKVLDSYWLYLPQKYEKTKKYPLILFLTGGYGVSPNPETSKGDGPSKFAMANVKDPELASIVKDSFIIINPHMMPGAYERRQWFQFHDEILDILKKMKEDYAIDESRVYLTGLSRGGIGSWEICKKSPDQFAALVTIAGEIGCRKNCENIGDKPIWIIHNDGDKSISVENPRNTVKYFKEELDQNFYQIPTVNIQDETYLNEKRIYSEIEKDGHDAWNSSYASKQLYYWLLKQKLNSNIKN